MHAAQQGPGLRRVDVVYARPGRRHRRTVRRHQRQTGHHFDRQQPEQAAAAREPPAGPAGHDAIAQLGDPAAVAGPLVEPVAQVRHGAEPGSSGWHSSAFLTPELGRSRWVGPAGLSDGLAGRQAGFKRRRAHLDPPLAAGLVLHETTGQLVHSAGRVIGPARCGIPRPLAVEGKRGSMAGTNKLGAVAGHLDRAAQMRADGRKGLDRRLRRVGRDGGTTHQPRAADRFLGVQRPAVPHVAQDRHGQRPAGLQIGEPRHPLEIAVLRFGPAERAHRERNRRNTDDGRIAPASKPLIHLSIERRRQWLIGLASGGKCLAAGRFGWDRQHPARMHSGALTSARRGKECNSCTRPRGQ